MASENKYGQVTTERKQIPLNEPVFLLRAQDRLACQAVRYYAKLREKAGDSKGAKEVRRAALLMSKWPIKKLPD